MKLSEVINNNDDLYKHVEFKNGKFKAVRNSDSINVMFEFGGKEMGVYVPLEGWEEVKPPRQWSEKELMLFKVFPWAKWLSRERNGDILLSETKPEYVYNTTENYSYWEIQDSEEKFATISTENYKDVTTATFEESPVYIGDLKGE